MGGGDGESRLVELNEVAEGWVRMGEDGVMAGARGRDSLPRVGVGLPSSRDWVDEGGDDFYVAQRGGCASLLVICWGEEGR